MTLEALDAWREAAARESGSDATVARRCDQCSSLLGWVTLQRPPCEPALDLLTY